MVDKRRIAILAAIKSNKWERVAFLALRTSDDLQAALSFSSPRGRANYRVVSPHYESQPWETVCEGTREYCVGFAEGQHDAACRVVCGTFIVWPEAWYGAILGDTEEGAEHGEA